MTEQPLATVLTRARLPLYVRLALIGLAEAAGAIGIALFVRGAYHALVRSSTGARSIEIVLYAAGLSIVVAVSAALRAAERVTAERLGQHYVTEVRGDLFAHLTNVTSRNLGRRRRGTMLLRFVGDLSALRNWVSLGLARLLVAGVTVGAAVAALTVIDTRIGLAVALVVVLGSLATWRSGRPLMAAGRLARRRRARLTGEVVERLTNLGAVQACGQQRREQRRVGRLSAAVSDAMIGRARSAGLSRAIAEGVSGLATVAVVVVGAIEVRAGRASPGTVLGALTVVGTVTAHVRVLGAVTEYWAAAKVARAAARRFLALPTLHAPPHLPNLPNGPGRLVLAGVRVEGALEGISVRAEPGQTIAVIGSNGAGKSTLVAVAARLLDPDLGSVELDGVDLRSCRLSSVRAAIAIASPDLPLLRGTVERNVLYRHPGADPDEVARVSALCGLDALIGELPDGWHTEVGDAGARLSSGQRARLLLARAALGQPRVLILDEADAHLDPVAAEGVDRVLADRSGTALVVTHRRDLVERADVVWCLQDGRLVEAGPPEVLLLRDGPTARLLGSAVPAPAGLQGEDRQVRSDVMGPAQLGMSAKRL